MQAENSSENQCCSFFLNRSSASFPAALEMAGFPGKLESSPVAQWNWAADGWNTGLFEQQAPEMKITIDTKEDSHEEIVKILQVLAEIKRGKEPLIASDTSDLMSMFNAPEMKTTSEFNGLSPQEKKMDLPKVELY